MTTEVDRAEAKRPRGISRIDPALRAAAAGLELAEFRTESLPGERERANRLAAERAAAVDATDVHIEDRAVAGPDGEQLVLRLYRGPGTSPAPLAVYAHGGGFVTGNLDTDHAHCVQLAREANCLVVAVDYRLAPEHPCPAALDDVETAFRYVVENSSALVRRWWRRWLSAPSTWRGRRFSPRCCTSRCWTPTRRRRAGNSSARRV
jgi:acetyl esterase